MSRFPSDPWSEFPDVGHSVAPIPSPNYDPYQDERGDFQPPAPVDRWAEFQDVTPPAKPALPARPVDVNAIGAAAGHEAALANTNATVRGGVMGPIVSFGQAIPRMIAKGGSAIAPEIFRPIGQKMDEYYGTAQNIPEQLGELAGPVVGATIAGPLALAATFGASGAGGVREDIAARREQGQAISGKQEAASAGLTGAIDAAAGYFGGKLFKGASQVLKGIPGLDAIIAKEGVKGVLGVIQREMPSLIESVGINAAQTFADNIVKKFSYNPEQKLGEGVGEAAVMGAVGHGIGRGLHEMQPGSLESHTTGHVDTEGKPITPPSSNQPTDIELASMSETELAKRYPDLIKGEPTITKAEADVAVKQQADQADLEQQINEPKKKSGYTSKAEIIDSIPNGQADKFAIANKIESETDPFVRVEVTPADFAPIPRENLDLEKARNYAGMDPSTAPPVIAGTAGNGQLRIADGRHRLLAAALRARDAGQPGETGKFMAVVPESWAKANGRLPVEGRQGSQTVQAHAEGYVEEHDLPVPEKTDEAKINVEQATRIAAAYDAAEHAPSDPLVKSSYEAFKQETQDQWDYLHRQGVKFEPWKGKGQPYKNSAEMQADAAKGHLWYFTGGDMPADHPMAEQMEDGVSYNDAFRAVHDYFGHAKDGNQFGPRGEENAWRTHSQMYTARARGAMTAETRGQNSWVNFGPKGAENRANPKNTQYAPQKATLLPNEFDVPGNRTPEPARIAGFKEQAAAEAKRLIEGGEPPRKPPTPDQVAAGDEGMPPRANVSTDAADESNPDRFAALKKVASDVYGVFREPTTGPLGALEKQIIRSKGSTALSAMDADTIGAEYTKAAKAAGVDPESADVHRTVEAILRGKASTPEMQSWAKTTRAALDSESENLARALRSVGLEKQAKAVEDNLGTYLKNVPIESVSPTAKIKDWAKRKLALSPSFGKVKRDKFIVWDRNKPLQKFDTQVEAEAFLDSKIQERKAQMITQAGRERGVSEEDLNRKAGRGYSLTAPISEEWRAEKEIHDPRYLAARSIVETRHNAEMIGLFDFAAKEYGVPVPEGLKGDDVKAWAEENGLAEMPEAGRLHALKDTYVPQAVADRLTEHAALPGEVERLYRAMLAAWKASKTVYNPGTHARNWVTNSLVFADLADASPLNPANWGSYKKAVDSAVKKDDVYRASVKAGLIGNEYSSTELQAIKDSFTVSSSPLDGIFHALGKVHKTVLKSYDAGDIVMKLAAVHNYVRKGMSLDAAIAETDEWYPNYARTGKITRWLRNSPVGAPFVSFFDQSVRIAGRAVARKPLKVMKIVALPVMLNMLSRSILGVRKDEDKLVQGESSVSRFMQPLITPIMPVRDKNGRVMTLDLTSILPLANDLVPQVKNGSLRIPWLMSGPLATSVIEQWSGQESFTGRPFINDKMTLGEQMGARGKQLWNTLAPVPSLASYGAERISKAATGGSDESVGRAVLGAIGGLNIRTPYIAEGIVKKVIENMIGDKDRTAARSLLDEWNNTYKPGDKTKLKMSSLVQGMRESMKQGKHKVRDKAAEDLIRGGDADAQKAIDEYNAERPNRLTPLTLDQAQRQAATLQRKGRTR